MIKKIIIPYFPKSIKYVSPVFIVAGIYLLFIQHWVWGILLLLASVIILTTRYVTELDIQRRQYDDYLFFLGFKLNHDKEKFNKLNQIVVTKGTFSTTVNTRVQSRQFDYTDFTGTLIFDNHKTLDLITRTDKRELLLGLKEFAKFLQVEIQDRSTGDHYWIDLDKVK